MLILGRKAGEAILIGGDVRIVVLSADRKGVRLGIEAPADVRVIRDEIVGSVAEENRRATAPGKEWLELIPVHARARQRA